MFAARASSATCPCTASGTACGELRKSSASSRMSLGRGAIVRPFGDGLDDVASIEDRSAFGDAGGRCELRVERGTV